MKAFQSIANRPLCNSSYFIVKKFELVLGKGGCTVRSKLNQFEHVGGGGLGPCTGGQGLVESGGLLWGPHKGNPLPHGRIETDMTENITFSQLCWWAVMMAITLLTVKSNKVWRSLTTVYQAFTKPACWQKF